jgi:hypothetical protein
MIHFHSARFEPPAGWVDNSVLSFVDRANAPGLSLTVAQEALTGGEPALAAYVADQQRAAQKAVPGYASVSTTARKIANAPALFVEGTAPSAARTRRVVQLYVLDAPRDRVFIVTATAGDADAARLRDAVEHVGKTFQLGDA